MNGETAHLGQSADAARDDIRLDGKPVRAETHEYWMLNKPTGVLTTARDTHGRQTVLDLLPDRSVRLFPVGRLDRDTEGLVLLTNDGALAHALLHPSHEVEREYQIRVRGNMGPDALRRLARGVVLDDGPTAPAAVSQVQHDPRAGTTELHLTLIEGRKRQIRRALRALGHPVMALRRIRLGTLRLGRLTPGESRPLSGREQRALERLAGRSPTRRQ